MTIRIVRNANGNCIQFVGSSQPAYWNSCLSGRVNPDDDTRVDIINDIRTTDSNNPFFEFYAYPYTEFTDADGNSFASAQEATDYITAQANVVSGGALEFSATDTIDFERDATNTSILLSTGDTYAVHAIKAVVQTDNNIKITENVVTGGADLIKDIRPANVTIGEKAPTSITANAVVNALNSLFTVTPLGLGDVDPVSSYTTVASSVNRSLHGDVTISGDYAVKGSNTGSQNNDAVSTSVDYLTQVGEYHELDWGSVPNGTTDYGDNFVMGFFKTSTGWSPDGTEYGGLDMALRLNGLGVYENHNFGVVIENGYYNNPHTKQKFRMGIDSTSRLYISFFDPDANEWQVAIRSAFPVDIENEDYHVAFMLKEENARFKINSLTANEIDPASFAVQYRYIESPDGTFFYPLFATAQEANWVDQLNGGSGTSHTHSFPDELPTTNTWYMPTTGGTHTGTAAPTNTDSVTYTEILTGADANYVPSSFGSQTFTIDENATSNYQIDPAGANWTTAISGQPAGMSYSLGNLVGTAPEVTGNNVDNPSDEYTITVTRTNSFGTTTGTLTLTVNNLDAPSTAISGFTHETGSDALVDSDTLAAGSVVSIDNEIDDGNRFIIYKEFIDNHILPAITSGSGEKSVFIGFKDSAADWGSVNPSDFDLTFEFVCDDSSRANNFWRLRVWMNNLIQVNHSITGLTSGQYDLVMINDDTTLKVGALTESAGHNPTSKVFDSASSDWVHNATLTGQTAGNKKIYIGTVNCTLDIDADDFAEVTEPVAPTNSTSWTKALDFSGGAEHAYQTLNASTVNPIRMSDFATGIAAPTTAGNTAYGSSVRPWATAIVFKSDGNSSNQHIWNQGEGASSTNDNIYVRQASNGYIYFGWGRDGALNECFIGDGFNTPTQQWHGLYIAHTGERLSGSNATAANLADCFDIRFMRRNVNNNSEWEILTGGYGDNVGNRSTTNNWNAGSTGGRMDRAVTGDLTIGGRGGNRNFHGKVASMVVTTLEIGVAMPTDAEIEMMITDPVGWVTDYKIGNDWRLTHQAASVTNFQTGSENASRATQVWLMGDGSLDSYANGIRNYILTDDSTVTKLTLNSMVSNDIETVSIAGLS